MSLELVIVVALATYRVARMLTEERGPFDLFTKFQTRLILRPQTWITFGLSCQLCMGFWVAILFYALVNVPVVNWLIYALAAAGAQVCLVRFFQ